MSDRAALIDQMREQIPKVSVRALCREVGINRAWYYQRSKEKKRARENELISFAVAQLHQDAPAYGVRRVRAALHRMGLPVNHKRVERIMRENGWHSTLPRRGVRTTWSTHAASSFPNLLKEVEVQQLNQCWVADLTYIRLLGGRFVYLATIVDAFSRKCIGWALSERLSAPLTLEALEMALKQRQPDAGLIHHSDHGVQYACREYVQRLRSVGASISMAGVGKAYENGQAESFFKTLKYEEVYLHSYESFEQAQASLATFLQEVYNARRLHSRLGYRPPDEFESLITECQSSLVC